MFSICSMLFIVVFCVDLSCYLFFTFFVFLFFKQRTAYDMRISDWSSDVCSSDLLDEPSAVMFGLTCGRMWRLFFAAFARLPRPAPRYIKCASPLHLFDYYVRILPQYNLPQKMPRVIYSREPIDDVYRLSSDGFFRRLGEVGHGGIIAWCERNLTIDDPRFNQQQSPPIFQLAHLHAPCDFFVHAI